MNTGNRAIHLLLAALTLGVVACGQEKAIGDACIQRDECPGLRTFSGECAFNQPNGYCTRGCLLDADCDRTSFCLSTPTGQVCVRQCGRAEDCRITDGYSCLPAGSGRSYCGLPGT